jgi:hypothetical protein
MAVTQAATDTLQEAGQKNTDALVIGMRIHSTAQRKLDNTPNFSGESN